MPSYSSCSYSSTLPLKSGERDQLLTDTKNCAINSNEEPVHVVQRLYYVNDLLNKRGLEDLHVIMWMLKDFAWIRCWRLPILVTLAVLAVSLAFVISILDLLSFFRRNRRNKFHRIDNTKELINGLGSLFWLLGNCWWAYGEVWDLRETAGYNDIYTQYSHQASYILYISGIVLLVFWICNFCVEVFGLSKSIYQLRLVRHANFLMYNNKEVTFEIPELVPNEPIEVSPIAAKEVPLQADERCCSPNIPQDRDGYEDYSSMSIPGVPYKMIGFVGVPAGLPNPETGRVSDKRSFHFTTKGLFSFRDYENLVIFFWVFKDICWYWEEPVWAKCLWLAVSFMAFYIVFECFVTLLYYYKSCSLNLVDAVHAFALLLWICCNILWGFGEMFIDEYVEDLHEDPHQAIAYLVPSLFTKPSDLPPGPWLLRFIAGWLLFSSIIFLLSSYVYFVASDLFTLKQRRSVRSSTQEDQALLEMERAKLSDNL